MDRTYPHGVTCWIDVEEPDVDAAQEFYGGLLGWDFTVATPPDAPWRYVVASVGGQDVAALAEVADGPGRWSTYVAVDDADAVADRAVALGATLVRGPKDAGPAGREAALRDPEGYDIRLWQARRRLGAQLTNAPGTWNFSNLHTADLDAAQRFYGELFPWRFVDQGWATAISVPGYGDHLEATVDPDIRTRQADAPRGLRGRHRSHRRRPATTRRAGPSSWPSPTATPRRPRVVELGGTVAAVLRDRLVGGGARPRPPGRGLHGEPVHAPDGWE